MLRLVSRIWPRALAFAGFAASDRTSEGSDASRFAWRQAPAAKASQARLVRHLFAIELLPSGRTHHGYDYRYYCVRCHWLFMVDRNGGVIALDAHNRALAISEGCARRVRTFAYGPCDGSGRVTSIDDCEPPARVTRIHRSRRLKARFSASL